MATDPQTCNTDFPFDITNLSEGRHSVFLYLPQSFHSHIGLVVALWGNFEVAMDQFLGLLIDAEALDGSARDTKHWKNSNFKKRRRILRDICNEWLAKKNPDVAARLLGILDSTGHLHWQRNMIVHGNYGYTILASSSQTSDCYAYNGERSEKLRFDEAVLKRLCSDISHLTADLVIAFGEIAKINSMPFAVISDSELLRIYRDTTHPWNPDPAKRPQSEVPGVDRAC